MIIDFRLRPPYGGFLKAGMYADKQAADFYAERIGVKRPESAKKESMPLLFEEMAENGITLGVATGRMGHHKGSVPNSDIVELVNRWPDKFAGMAGLDAADPAGSIDAIHRYCINGPLKGVVLEPGASRSPVFANDKKLYPIYEECEKYNIPVQIMIGGRAGPDRSYSSPMIISKIAGDFPDVNFIAAHGCWPYVMELLGICFYQENIYVCPDLYFFNLPGQEEYIKAANGYLSQRFIFASAYPFIPLDCVKQFEKSFNENVLPDLLYNNAARLLGL